MLLLLSTRCVSAGRATGRLCCWPLTACALPARARAQVFKLLRPGGFLFWHTPFQFEQHGVPADFFRYTVAGAQALAESAGARRCCRLPADSGTASAAGGASAAAAGWLLLLQVVVHTIATQRREWPHWEHVAIVSSSITLTLTLTLTPTLTPTLTLTLIGKGLVVESAEPDGGYLAVLSNVLGLGSSFWGDGDLQRQPFPGAEVMHYLSTRMVARKPGVLGHVESLSVG